MSFTIRNRVRAPRRVAAIVLALVIGVPATALAADLFADVPGTNIFKDPIEALAGAGITAGCGGGNFCPTSAITREQEAAFLNRALPRVARTVISTVQVTGGAGFTEVGSVSIQVGGTNSLAIGANQFVKVDVTFTFYGTPESACPCNFRMDIREDGVSESANDGATFGVILPGQGQQTVTLSRVFEATPGVHTYNASALWTGTGTMTAQYGSIIATTIPFGYDGGNNLGQVGITSSDVPQAAPGANAGD
jgi:hypothetical protein